ALHRAGTITRTLRQAAGSHPFGNRPARRHRKDSPMRRFVGPSMAFVMVFATVAFAADTHDSLVKELLTTLKDAVGVLTSVKDDKTAKDASPKVDKISEKMGDIKKRMEKIGKPTPDEEKVLKEKYKDEMEKTFKSFAEELGRVAKVPGGEDII